MNISNSDSIKALRERIQVGIAYALEVLEKVNWNIEIAEHLIKEEYTAILAEKTGVSREVALESLSVNEFDIENARIEIERKVYSNTELILRIPNKDKEDTISLVLDIIKREIELSNDKDQELTVHGWFNFELLKFLNPYQFCFGAIAEWLSYKSYEGFDYAIEFHTDTIIEQIEKTLLLTEIANSIRMCKKRKQYFYEKYKNREDGFILACNKVKEDSVFKANEKYYFENEKQLIETLYNFIKAHIEHFP
ncbi:hypothetical protein [Emticicia fluvialis]|uniref:hypothetical protein n=1 Tax=Emticicia fluvialis TaxID=2974474 RepID=UPI002165CCC7|nr:hypothetical protein [Emticicia fluvialis]